MTVEGAQLQEQHEEQQTLLAPKLSTLQGPWWMSPWAFWPASLLLLSWPLRVKFIFLINLCYFY
jgi:hypothetical protein